MEAHSQAEIQHLAPDVETLARRLAAVDYLVDEGLATSMFLALSLPQPLLLEGEAGVGKTEAAKSLALAFDTPLVRLQCYDGIDAAEALYEWNYPRQLLSIRLAEALRAAAATVELELVPGATHFWNGASDVGAIVRRSVQFLRGLSSA